MSPQRVDSIPLTADEMLPDYGGGSILNLMRSVADACGFAAQPYAPLDAALTTQLASATRLVLLVIDGMGDALLSCAGQGTAFAAHRATGLTSVFPSTTAAAVTTLLTGLAPARHGLTGWHMHLAEAAGVLAILPLRRRQPPAPGELPRPVPVPETLFDHRGLFGPPGRASWTISPADIADSPFNRFHTRGCRVLAHGGAVDLFARIAETVRASDESSFIYAYHDGLDATSHRYGAYGEQAVAELQALDAGFAALLDALAGSDTTVIVTADHGFIDSPPAHWIDLTEHADLRTLLAQPLCGEPRVAWCYVAPGRELSFEEAVTRRFGDALRCLPSRALLDAGWFGPGEMHPRLAERIGTHALLMRDDWTIRDWLPGERRYRQYGVHGGVSKREMQVPLIIAHT